MFTFGATDSGETPAQAIALILGYAAIAIVGRRALHSVTRS